MILVKPRSITDPAEVARACGHWLVVEKGLRIVEYRMGNSFTGNIDILAVGADKVYLVIINTSGFAEALLGGITSLRWFVENRAFLEKLYGTDDVSFSGTPVVAVFSASFPPGIKEVLSGAMKVDFLLFKYSFMGTDGEPLLCVEEMTGGASALESHDEAVDPDALIQELGIEQARLTHEEIREFLAAMRQA